MPEGLNWTPMNISDPYELDINVLMYIHLDVLFYIKGAATVE